VSVESTDHKHFTFVLTNPVWTGSAPSTPELVFDKYENNNFLAKVIGSNTGREIPLSSATMKKETDRVAEVVSIPASSVAQR
jgi:hypothetical protein